MELDDAIENLSYANSILSQDMRDSVKRASYLGELTDLSILKDGFVKAEKWLPVLKRIHPTNNSFDHLVNDLKKEIKKFTPKPKVEKPVEKVVEKPVVEKKEEIIKPQPVKPEPEKKVEPKKTSSRYPFHRGGK